MPSRPSKNVPISVRKAAVVGAFLCRLALCSLTVPLSAPLIARGSTSGRDQIVSTNKACSTAEYRQFDFWLGDWDVSDFAHPGTADAHVRVDRILDGCVVHESYDDKSGLKGESFSMYDATTSTWHQTWVTNRGRLLSIDGQIHATEMVLSGRDLTPEGKKRLVRGIWKPVKAGVRETAVISLDDGKTWIPWFDLLFRRHMA